MSIVAIIIALLGLYLLLVHADPLPLNHEAIGLGKEHLTHVVEGLVLLAGSAFLFLRARRRPTPAAR